MLNFHNRGIYCSYKIGPPKGLVTYPSYPNHGPTRGRGDIRGTQYLYGRPARAGIAPIAKSLGCGSKYPFCWGMVQQNGQLVTWVIWMDNDGYTNSILLIYYMIHGSLVFITYIWCMPSKQHVAGENVLGVFRRVLGNCTLKHVWPNMFQPLG